MFIRHGHQAFNHGVSVLCEKPLAMNKEEATTIKKRAEEARLIHDVFQFSLFGLFPMKELMQKVMSTVSFMWKRAGSRSAGRIEHVGWRDQKKRSVWRQADAATYDPAPGAGDLKRFVASLRFSPRILVDGSESEVTAEDCCVFVGELAGGGLVSFSANAAARGSSCQEIRILGNDGMLRAEVDRTKIDWMIGTLWGAQGDNLPQLLPIPERLTRGFKPSDERRDMAEFIFSNLTHRLAHGIRTGEQPSPSFHDGLEVQKVLDAVKSR